MQGPVPVFQSRKGVLCKGGMIMKEEYQGLVLETVVFESEDIIATSPKNELPDIPA